MNEKREWKKDGEKKVEKKRGQKKYRRYLKGAAAFLFFAGAVVCLIISEYQEETGRLWMQVLTGTCAAFSIICMVGDDGAERLKNFVGSVGDILTGFMGKVLKAVAKFFGMRLGSAYKGEGFISGYQDFFVRVNKQTGKKKSVYRNYRDMNNRERVRYFYSRYLNRQIRKGYTFKPYTTPNEIEKELLEKKRMEEEQRELFRVYNIARYNEMADITEENVEKMRKICKKVNDKNKLL